MGYNEQDVKKYYSDSFTNKNCKIEAERRITEDDQSLDKHLEGQKTAHIYCLCAAFQPLKGSVLVSERLTFTQKEAPRENKALTFFHADISFF